MSLKNVRVELSANLLFSNESLLWEIWIFAAAAAAVEAAVF